MPVWPKSTKPGSYIKIIARDGELKCVILLAVRSQYEVCSDAFTGAS